MGVLFDRQQYLSINLIILLVMQYSNSQSLNTPNYQLTPSRNYLLENNMGHPQRRKMYNMHDRHNLISKIDMTWLNSLQEDNLTKKRVIEQKRTNGLENLVGKYNQFVDRELNQRYKNDLGGDFGRAESEGKRSGVGNGSGLYNSQMLSGQSVTLDRSLNQQIQNFRTKNQRKNSSHSTQNSPYSPPIQALDYNAIHSNYNHYHDISPKQMKQLILRSALDRPQIYQQYQSIDNSTIRNNKPDNLETYLRRNDRRRYI